MAEKKKWIKYRLVMVTATILLAVTAVPFVQANEMKDGLETSSKNMIDNLQTIVDSGGFQRWYNYLTKQVSSEKLAEIHSKAENATYNLMHNSSYNATSYFYPNDYLFFTILVLLASAVLIVLEILFGFNTLTYLAVILLFSPFLLTWNIYYALMEMTYEIPFSETVVDISSLLSNFGILGSMIVLLIVVPTLGLLWLMVIVALTPIASMMTITDVFYWFCVDLGLESTGVFR